VTNLTKTDLFVDTPGGRSSWCTIFDGSSEFCTGAVPLRVVALVVPCVGVACLLFVAEKMKLMGHKRERSTLFVRNFEHP
jgi:hypothetical protein